MRVSMCGCDLPINQFLGSNEAHRIMAPLCQISILQQMNTKKNGFHCVRDNEIGVSYHIGNNSKLFNLVEGKSKAAVNHFIRFRRQIEPTGKCHLFTEF